MWQVTPLTASSVALFYLPYALGVATLTHTD
jgi:hypothetical protein